MTQQQLMILGHELEENEEVGAPIGLPKEAWNQHLLITGETGSGKTTTATTALTTAHQHSAGPTIVLDPKGTGWIQELARTQYTKTGSLADVYVFNILKGAPAFSFFDVGRSLSAGIDRELAVQHTANHFLELLDHLKKPGQEAVRSPDVIRYFIRALFDPVHGGDAFTLQDFIDALAQFREAGTLPAVSQPATQELLEGIETGSHTDVKTIMQGVRTRVDKVYGNSYLRPLFNHVSTDADAGFAFDEWLQQDVFLLFDLSGPDETTTPVIANLLLTELWNAIRRRSRNARTESLPLGLLCVDEAAHLKIGDPLAKFFREGREYDLGIVSLLQSPDQLEGDGETAASQHNNAYNELLQNTQSFLAGGVSNAPAFFRVLSQYEMSEGEIQNRLSGMPLERWLFRPAKLRDIGPVSPMYLEEAPLPPGHPDGPQPLSPDEQTAFRDAFSDWVDETLAAHGIRYESATSDAGPGATTASDEVSPVVEELHQNGWMSTFPLVGSLPQNVLYDPDPAAVVCPTCGANRTPTLAGFLNTIRCHGTLEAVAREDVPPVELGVTLTADEIAAAPVEPRLLCALQIIANIAARTYDSCEIDLVHDSPHDVLALFDVTATDIQTLADEGLITIDKLRKYSYYTVTKDGRELLRQPYTKGAEWGHHRGDNTETLLHIVMVEALRRYAKQTYVQDADSPIVTVDPYFEVQESMEAIDLDGGTRFDLVGLDADGQIRLIGEAERKNNDSKHAALNDFDQITTVGPDHALWVVPSSSKGRDAVLNPLANPPQGRGEPRIKSYSDSTRIPQISGINEPGMTDIFTLNQLRKQLPEPTLEE